MKNRFWIALSMCLSMCLGLAACEPRGTPQQPKTAEPIATLPAPTLLR